MPEIIPLEEKSLPEDCFVFKHSTRCPVSFSAADEVKATEFPLPLYWVNVVEQRELSNWVTEELSTTHQSPQLIKRVGGEVEKVWNHNSIRKDDIS